MKTNNIIRILIGTALVLAIPLLAMQFSHDVNWRLSDFVIIGALLIGAGLAFEFIKARLKPQYRWLLAAGMIMLVLLIWAELAVGVIGTPFAGS